MNNVIQFPTPDIVRVTAGSDAATGEKVYVFELVEGTLRNVIATYTTVEEATIEAADLMGQGYDVSWDEPMRSHWPDPNGGSAA